MTPALSPTMFEGTCTALPGRYAVVVSRYNESITERLCRGALDTLQAHGVRPEAIDLVWVPGAFEIPLPAARLASCDTTRAVICLGAVIRGETTHDQHINRAVSDQLAEISVRSGVPVMFGVLTCETLEQAIQRSGGNVGNKGSECAEAALRMADLLSRLPGECLVKP